jgi:hypothetical protein
VRRVVAVGNLHKLWGSVPENLDMAGLKKAFRGYFGAEWTDVLDAADISFAYNAANTAYFAVRDLRPVEALTLNRLLADHGGIKPLNLIVS